MTRDGQAPATANLSLGGFRLTNVGTPVASTDAINLAGLNAQTDSYGGTSAGTANAQTATFANFTNLNGQKVAFIAGATNSGSMTLNGTTVYKLSSGGAAVLSGGEIVNNVLYLLEYSSGIGGFQIIGPSATATLSALGVSADVAAAITAGSDAQCYADLGGAVVKPQGRLTLTTAVPVLIATVTSGATIYYTPHEGNLVPLWNSATSTFVNVAFAEISQALTDTVNSPAAAVVASAYDLFVWSKAGVVTLSRGPAWSNTTTRGYTLTRTNGILVNTSSITNGPAGGFGTYVGTILTDTTTTVGVTFAPQPAAASGGPTTGTGGVNAGAWIGLWNYYNQSQIAASAQDSKATWTTTSTSLQTLDGSNTNRVTWINGLGTGSAGYQLTVMAATGNTVEPACAAVGFNSVTVQNGAGIQFTISANDNVSGSLWGAASPIVGANYFQALQAVISGATATFVGGSIGPFSQVEALTAQVWF